MGQSRVQISLEIMIGYQGLMEQGDGTAILAAPYVLQYGLQRLLPKVLQHTAIGDIERVVGTVLRDPLDRIVSCFSWNATS
jgi:hypothetical protein